LPEQFGISDGSKLLSDAKKPDSTSSSTGNAPSPSPFSVNDTSTSTKAPSASVDNLVNAGTEGLNAPVSQGSESGRLFAQTIDVTSLGRSAITDAEFLQLAEALRSDPELLQQLIDELRQETDSERRTALARLLGEVGGEGLTLTASELIYSGDAESRRIGLDLLRKIQPGNAAARDIASTLLATEVEPEILVDTLSVLAKPGSVDDSSRQFLSEQVAFLAEHESAAVRSVSLDILSRWSKDGQYTEVLRNGLSDVEPVVRELAAYSLVGHDNVSPALIDSLLLVAEDSSELDRPRRGAILHEFADAQIAQNNFAGIAWRIEHLGKKVDEGLLGYSDHALAQPLQHDTLFRVYSMTKPIVSVCCLQLMEAGKLRLDDPISRWIPEFATMSVLNKEGKLESAHRQITIEDLLMHRSGLSYDFLQGCPVAKLYREARLAEDGTRSLKDLVTLLADFPLALQPGQRWYYSYATDVLAYVLECVTDKTIGDSLRTNLFEPLGMSETGFDVDSQEQHRVADMFGQRELGQEETGDCTTNDLRAMDVSQSYPMSSNGEFARGGIGLFSTLADYQRFLPVLMHGNSADGEPLLSAMTIEMLWQNRLSQAQMPIAIGDKAYEGYGWGLTGRVMADTASAATVSAAGEGGWAGAASTYFWVDRANDVTGVIMAQYLGSAVALGPSMQSLAYGALCHRSPAAS